jgi:hypothetical protein
MMMKMHGMQDGAYWLVQYSWFLMLYIVYAAAFLIFGTATRLGLFTFNDYGEYSAKMWSWAVQGLLACDAACFGAALCALGLCAEVILCVSVLLLAL